MHENWIYQFCQLETFSTVKFYLVKNYYYMWIYSEANASGSDWSLFSNVEFLEILFQL